MKINLPHYVISVARVLIKEGYKAYLVAGAIRDTIIGIQPHDYDIATDALPEDLIRLFPKSIAVGAQFGTVVVLQPDATGENFSVEVTTLRSEEDYLKGRWPSKVTFVRNLEDDLQRRDFTMNAMALDLGEFGVKYLESHPAIEQEHATDHLHEYEFTLIDYYNGAHDIESRIIRTVGDPVARFTEDGLRPYRACRFASQLGFAIDEQTFIAITRCLNVSSMVSTERVRDEFMKLLLKSSKPSHGIELLRISGLLNLFLPELAQTKGVTQDIGHAFDVYDHTLRAVDLASDNVKLATLFHDIGKPQTANGNGHFYGHDQLGADLTEKIMKRLRFSNAEIKRTSNLVRWHMFYYPYTEKELQQGPPDLEEQKSVRHWSDGAVRRFIRRVGLENIEDLFALRIADATSEPESMWSPEEIVALQARISKVLEEDTALKIADLDIDGKDIMAEFGIAPSPIIGKTLSHLLDLVIENPNLNGKVELLRLAKEFIEKESETR